MMGSQTKDRYAGFTAVPEQRGIILAICADVISRDGLDSLHGWFEHVGFDVTALRDPSDLAAAWLGHYRRGHGYDVERAMRDHLTWPPIADRIASLSKQMEKQASNKAKRMLARKAAG